VATARNVDDLADLDVAHRLALDVTDQTSVDRAVRAAGEIDVLVSNAGRTVRSPIETVPIDEVRNLFELNTVGALRVTQALLPAMRVRGSGRLLYISSILGRLTIPLVGPYAASKWSLEAIVETLAVEVERFGIGVTILEPGPVSSEVLQSAHAYLDGDVYAQLVRARSDARGTTITPEEVAVAVADAIEMADAPFRIPVGEPAAKALAGRKAHPDEVAYRVPGLVW
jgi:NADP-dependent 3-hydroxy acid dehydrogenase YdfG